MPLLGELIVEIGEREFIAAKLLLQLSGLLLVERGLGLFDQRQHVAHPEDAGRHAAGVERLDLVELLARADELDRLARNGLDRKGRAAARVAVELGEDDAVDVEVFVERLRGVDRVLTGHRVDDEQDLIRLDLGLDGLQLVHERLVDVQTARRVEENHVVAVPDGVGDGGFRNVDRVRLPHLEDGDAELSADDLKLLNGRRTVDVAGDKQRIFILLFEQARKLRAVRRFTGALQADEHHDRGRLRRHVDLLVFAAHQGGKLFVDDLDNHLRGRQALEHVRANGALGGLFDEVLDDLIADVGL